MKINSEDEWRKIMDNGRYPLVEYLHDCVYQFQGMGYTRNRVSPVLILCDDKHYMMLNNEIIGKFMPTVVIADPDKSHWHNVKEITIFGKTMLIIIEEHFEGIRVLAEIKEVF